MNRETFAANRRTVLDKAEMMLAPSVRDSLAEWGTEDWFEPMLEAGLPLYTSTYHHEAGEDPKLKSWRKLERRLARTLAKTGEPDKTTAPMLTRYLATSIVNAATEAAADADEMDLEYEWVSMHDGAVRASHKAADGQRRRKGEPFHVGDAEMRYPGDTSAPIEEWIGCRCLLRPDVPAEALVASADTSTMSVIVALPAEQDPVHQMGPEQAHVTLVFLGKTTDVNAEAVARELAQTAPKGVPAPAGVSGRAELGKDKAQVLLVESEQLAALRDELLNQPEIMAAHDKAEQFPTWVPHLTLGYPGSGEIAPDNPDEITFDRLALWHGDEQTEYPLGVEMTAPTEQDPQQENAVPMPGKIPWHGTLAPEGAPSGDKRGFAKGSLRNRDLPLPLTWQKSAAQGHDGSVVVGMIEGITRIPGEAEAPNLVNAFGSFLQTPEADEFVGLVAEFGRFGVSVDLDDSTFEQDPDTEARIFTDARICSASAVPIPAFPEAYIRLGEAPPGHMGDQVEPPDEEFAVSEKSWDGSAGRFTPEQWKSSCILHLDDSLNKSSHKLPIKEPGGALSRAGVHAAASRIGSVQAPAEKISAAKGSLRSAYKALGEQPPDTLAGEGLEDFGRGPGWVTNPKGTSRLHTYWTVPGEPGYAKVGWGTEGDFGRCKAELGEEIGENSPDKLRFINQICAQWQHDAIGVWPGKGEKLAGDTEEQAMTLQPVANLVASAGATWRPPRAWFSEIEFDRPTRTTFVEHEEGTEVFGHIGEWNECHSDNTEFCTWMPRSTSPVPYALFHSIGGGLMTDDGLVDVGCLTVGGGHADTHMGLRGALAHYDDTSTVVADCRVWEDKFGIAFHGWIRPSATEEQRVAFRAAKLSGDWRMSDGHQELILAHAVNNPGFAVKPRTSVVDGQQLGLVAAGVLRDDAEEGTMSTPLTATVESVDMVDAVARGIAEHEARKARQAQLHEMAARHGVDPASRMARINRRFGKEE